MYFQGIPLSLRELRALGEVREVEGIFEAAWIRRDATSLASPLFPENPAFSASARALTPGFPMEVAFKSNTPPARRCLPGSSGTLGQTRQGLQGRRSGNLMQASELVEFKLDSKSQPKRC